MDSDVSFFAFLPLIVYAAIAIVIIVVSRKKSKAKYEKYLKTLEEAGLRPRENPENQQKATWIFIMLTALRKQLGLSHASLAPLVKEYEVIPFLWDQYELLHYYDNEYIINYTLKHIEEKGGNLHELCRRARRKT